MTNAVGSIFNESFVEKKRFVGSVNSACDPLEKQKKAGAHSQQKKRKCQNTNAGFVLAVPKRVLNKCVKIKISFVCCCASVSSN